MVYILSITLGIVVGIILKGKVSNILNLKFEKVWIILLAFMIQVTAQILGYRGFDVITGNIFLIQACVFCLLFLGFWFNRQYLGILVIGAGGFLNAVVMMLNGGKMPVSLDVLASANLTEAIDMLKSGLDNKHAIINESTRLGFMADTIFIPGFPGLLMRIVSIGDLIVIAGFFLLLVEVVSGRTIFKRPKTLNEKNGGIVNEKTD